MEKESNHIGILCEHELAKGSVTKKSIRLLVTPRESTVRQLLNTVKRIYGHSVGKSFTLSADGTELEADDRVLEDAGIDRNTVLTLA